MRFPSLPGRLPGGLPGGLAGGLPGGLAGKPVDLSTPRCGNGFPPFRPGWWIGLLVLVLLCSARPVSARRFRVEPASQPTVASHPVLVPPAAEDDDAKEAEWVPLPRFLQFWHQGRRQWSEKGFDWYAETSGDLYRTLRDSAGNRDDVFGHDIYLQLSVDLKRAGLGSRGTFLVSGSGYWERNWAKSPTAPAAEEKSAGDEEGEGNEPSSAYKGFTQTGSPGAVQFYELYYERPFRHGSVVVGWRDLTNDFYGSEYAGALAHGGFFFGPDVSENVPMGIYSVGAPGVRVTWNLASQVTLLAGLYDGIPGRTEGSDAEGRWSGTGRNGLDLTLSRKDGWFRITEAQIGSPASWKNHPATLKLGTWHHSGRFNDLTNLDAEDVPLAHEANWGNYALYEQKVWNADRDGERGLGFYCQAGGQGPRDRSTVESAFAAGISFTGPFSCRSKDVFAFGWNRKKNNTRLRDANRGNGLTALGTEEVLEAAWMIRVNGYLTLRPNFQYIRNVGGDPARARTTAFGLRGTVVF